jgi:hypothetical protein
MLSSFLLNKEKHRNEMAPEPEIMSMIFGSIPVDGFLKFESQNHLCHLPEYAMIMTHSPTPYKTNGYDVQLKPL